MKKIVFSIFVLCIVTIMIVKNHNSQRSEINSLLLHNIEALAADEHLPTTQCFGEGQVLCPINNSRVKAVATGYSLEIY